LYAQQNSTLIFDIKLAINGWSIRHQDDLSIRNVLLKNSHQNLDT